MHADRSIRVFVSSTFRDMQEERDELILRVFPRLRRLCESRGVSWAEVDLRWGITDEQKAEGKVLPLCLEEIRRSGDAALHKELLVRRCGERVVERARDQNVIPPAGRVEKLVPEADLHVPATVA